MQHSPCHTLSTTCSACDELQMGAVGLVGVPGAMSGLMFEGVDPVQVGVNVPNFQKVQSRCKPVSGLMLRIANPVHM